MTQTNNPLNIRLNDTKWHGMASMQRGEFVTFCTLEFGLRAGFVLLNTYIKKYLLRTIREIITRWAPPTENDTDGYVSFVSSATHMDPDTPYAWNKKQRMSLIRAMCRMESGTKVSNQELLTAYDMA